VFPGRTKVLFGVSARGAGGLAGLCHGPQRRRQDDVAQHAHGVLSPARGHVSFDGKTSRVPRRQNEWRAGIGMYRKDTAYFLNSVSRKTRSVLEQPSIATVGDRRRRPRLFPRLNQCSTQSRFLSEARHTNSRSPRTHHAATTARSRRTHEGIQPSIIDEIEETISALATRPACHPLVEQYLDFALRLADSFVILERARSSAPDHAPSCTRKPAPPPAYEQRRVRLPDRASR